MRRGVSAAKLTLLLNAYSISSQELVKLRKYYVETHCACLAFGELNLVACFVQFSWSPTGNMLDLIATVITRLQFIVGYLEDQKYRQHLSWQQTTPAVVRCSAAPLW
jgi:hypothetical protein